MKISQINLRRIPEPNSCANCKKLRWGNEEGWDKCDLTEEGIDWSLKSKQVCDYHVKSNMPDPRIGNY
jgi:hypothetical protein